MIEDAYRPDRTDRYTVLVRVQKEGGDDRQTIAVRDHPEDESMVELYISGDRYILEAEDAEEIGKALLRIGHPDSCYVELTSTTVGDVGQAHFNAVMSALK